MGVDENRSSIVLEMATYIADVLVAWQNVFVDGGGMREGVLAPAKVVEVVFKLGVCGFGDFFDSAHSGITIGSVCYRCDITLKVGLKKYVRQSPDRPQWNGAR